MPLTALIVEDEPLAREGVAVLLSGDPDISAIYEASGGREAVAAIQPSRETTIPGFSSRHRSTLRAKSSPGSGLP